MHMIHLAHSNCNSQRARFIKDNDDKCHMFMADILEIIMHRFWDCKIAHRVWGFSIGIVNTHEGQH